MSEQDRIAFEKWAKDYGFDITQSKKSSATYAEYETHCAKLGYEAATTEANKRIAELEAVIETYTANANHAVDIHAKDAETIASLKARSLEESNKYVAYCDLAETKIAELESEVAGMYAELGKLTARYGIEYNKFQASNNDLREALKRALEDLVPHHTKPSTYKTVNEALSATPAESLQAHDDEVIEKCAVRGRLAQLESKVVDIEIRALKEVK